jgi:hypothetical protein
MFMYCIRYLEEVVYVYTIPIPILIPFLSQFGVEQLEYFLPSFTPAPLLLCSNDFWSGKLERDGKDEFPVSRKDFSARSITSK